MDIVFGQLHLLMLGTELEAVPADTVALNSVFPRILELVVFTLIVYVVYIRL